MRLAAFLPILAWSAALCAEGEAPLPDAAPIPEGALAMLTLKEHGAVLQATGGFCDAVVTNTGALALQSITSSLFPIPVQDGVDPKGPTAVFFIAGPDGRLTQGLAVSVTDPKAFERAIGLIFPLEMVEGCLQIAIPGGIDEPEQKYSIRIGKRMAVVAPDAAIVQRIEKAAGGDGAGAFLPRRGADVNLSVDLDAVRRAYGRNLETRLGGLQALVAGMLPGLEPVAGELREGLAWLVEDATFLELRGSFVKDGLQLSGRAKARSGGALYHEWNRGAPRRSKDLAGLLPERSGLALAFWNPKGSDPQKDPVRIGAAPKDRRPAPWFAKLGELVAASDLGAAAWTQTAPNGSVQLQMVFGAKRPENLEPKLVEALNGIAAFASDLARAQMRLQPEDPAPYTLQPLPAANDAKGWTVELAARYRIYPEVKAAFERVAEWPVSVRAARTEHALVVTVGRGNAAGLNVLRDGAQRIGDGTRDTDANLELQLRPVDILHTLLAVVLDPSTHKPGTIVKDLPDAPADFKAGAEKGIGWFEVILPKDAVKAFFDTYLKLRRAGIDLSRLALPEGDSAPAPPPLP